MLRKPPAGNEPTAGHAFAVLRTDEQGAASYRIGFSGSVDGASANAEITSAPAWLRHLEAAATAAPSASR